MSATESTAPKKPEAAEESGFDMFELVTAILLGLGAVGAAIAGLQAGLWGGAMTDAYAEATKLATEGSADVSQSLGEINYDLNIDLRAKQFIAEGWEAETNGDAALANHKYMLASYLYTNHISGEAYDALGLPAELMQPDEVAAADGTATEAPAGGTAEEMQTALVKALPNEALWGALDAELGEEFFEKRLTPGAELQAKADAKLAEARQHNEVGDKYDLVGVFFTVALFFAGLGLIFKTNMRWAFFGLGVMVFVGSLGFMFTLPWA